MLVITKRIKEMLHVLEKYRGPIILKDRVIARLCLNTHKNLELITKKIYDWEAFNRTNPITSNKELPWTLGILKPHLESFGTDL